MLFAVKQPGIYVEEIHGSAHPITAVSTSLTAFVGTALKGPFDEPVTVHNPGEFDRIFGGLWEKSTMSFAVHQYFQNGGNEAVIVRVKGNLPDKTSGFKNPYFKTSFKSNDKNASSGERECYIRDEDLVPTSPEMGTGIYALEKTDFFNILCLPPLDFGRDPAPETFAKAASYCENRRAMLLIDPPSEAGDAEFIKEFQGKLQVSIQKTGQASGKKNAALFFPRIKVANPLKSNLVEDFAPCGAVAGVFSRTDRKRGIWKAPAGMDAVLNGVVGLNYVFEGTELDELNRYGINCLRTLSTGDTVIWGARTLEGASAGNSEWKYIPVRRLALHIEESLLRGTKWVAFEPNSELLWAQLRLSIEAFMHSLFTQGVFTGKIPAEAYFVKCDRETTTSNDISQGFVNVLVGFAPLRPAEFIILSIRQQAGKL